MDPPPKLKKENHLKIYYQMLERRKMGLKRYAVRRILTGLITIIITMASLYFIFRLPAYVAGKDPARLYGVIRIRSNPGQQLTPEEQEEIIRELRESMGLPPKDASLAVRLQYFFKYMINTLTFDFGTETLPPYRPATEIFLEKLPYTLLLLGPTIFFQVLLGLSLGIQAGKDVESTKDKAITITGLSTYSLPSYWVQMLSIFLFVLVLEVYPALLGPTLPFQYREPFFKFLGTVFMFSLPIMTLVISGFGSWVYLMRNTLADVITEDYIFTARAKGLDETTILYKHALRNAVLPVWTNLVIAIATLWGGAVITETIFNLPGVGQRFIQAMLPPIDYAMEQMIFYFFALSVIGANVIADITYGILDPRVSYD